MASANNSFKSKEEYRRQQELEEARKAGLAPAAVDEDGNEINPHIPQYMSTAPWYLNNNKPSLKHQKNWRKLKESGQWYDRGAKGFQANKWRKGACENCGAVTHITKDCLERPRQTGARWNNKHIQADEIVQNLGHLGWDAKRDRWNGYDAKEYARVMDRHEKLEQHRNKIRKQQEVEKRYAQKEGEGKEGDEILKLMDGGTEEVKTDEAEKGEQKSGSEQGDGKDDGEDQIDKKDDIAKTLEDEDRILDEEDTGFAEVKKRVRTTAGGASGSVRNLRIREDTAKYLLNLDLNSAYYDPKSRSMREDPNPHKPGNEKTFAGDNFVRYGGDYEGFRALNLHSMVASDKGQDIHVQAAPSQAEMLYKEFKTRKGKLLAQSSVQIQDKYGDASEKLPEDARTQLYGQSEHYVEYDRLGRPIKGQETIVRSRYEEDVLINNHTSVWGSYWVDGQWGFACCHQFVKNSYCTGSKTKSQDSPVQNKTNEIQEQPPQQKKQLSSGSQLLGMNMEVWGDAEHDQELDEEKLQLAIKREEQRQKGDGVELDDRKRGFHSLKANEMDMSAEDMEAYRLKRIRADDPILAFKGKDFL